MVILPAILGLWKGLPAPIKKIAEYAALAGLAFWVFKVFWLNPHDNKIEAQARVKVSDEIKKDFDKQYKLQIDSLVQSNRNLQNEVEELEITKAELAKSRETLLTGFNRTLAGIKLIEDNNRAKDRDVPNHLLGQRIRDVSNELECARPGNIDRIGCPDGQTGIGATP